MRDKHDLYKALNLVLKDAKKQRDEHTNEIGGKPLFGWSQEKHDAYHTKNKVGCEMVIKWLEIRLMQINPD